MNHRRQLLIASLITSLTAGPGSVPRAFAQEDFPPPPDFDSGFPPPPDMGSSGGSPSGGGGTRGGAAGAAGGAGLSKAQQEKFNRSGLEDITNENFPETIESFDFPNVDITDLIKTIGELTGRNFIIDPGVRGKITIVAPSKITVAEAYKAFLSALAINGYTVVPSGSFLKVKNARNAQRDSIETYSGAYYPNDDQMITRIIHLKHISADIVNRELRILPSKDGEMSVYTPTNSIILSDYGSNIDRVMKIINQLDVPGFEEQIDVVRVKYAKSKDMAELIDKIVNKGQKSGGAAGAPGTFSSGVPRFSRSTGTQSQSGSSFFMAIPDDRTNSIIIVGNKSGILRVKRLIGQLDFPVRPDEAGGVYVYYVKHGDAEKIGQVLQGVAKDSAPKPGAGGNPASPFPTLMPGATAESSGHVFGGEVKINADKNTNSLVISASKQDYDQVLNLLAKIDIPRDQVYVEAIIMEMSVGDGSRWDVGYFRFGDSGYGKVGFNGGVNINEMLSPQGGSGAIIGFGQGKVIEVRDPVSNTPLKIPNLVGFINFLKSNTRTNILSTPQVTALDNQEALIEVGDKVATSVQETTTAAGTSRSANFEEATISLKIKPFISPNSDSIRMEIKQSVKQPTSITLPKALSETTVPLATRKIETNIVMRDGDTAVLGGLIKDQERETVTKIPLLGDLPILGWLFKSRNVNTEKVNLVVFLTPKILRTPQDRGAVLGKKLEERLDFVKASGGREPYGKKLDEIRNRSAYTPSSIFENETAPSGSMDNRDSDNRARQEIEEVFSPPPSPLDEPAPMQQERAQGPNSSSSDTAAPPPELDLDEEGEPLVE